MKYLSTIDDTSETHIIYIHALNTHVKETCSQINKISIYAFYVVIPSNLFLSNGVIEEIFPQMLLVNSLTFVINGPHK